MLLYKSSKFVAVTRLAKSVARLPFSGYLTSLLPVSSVKDEVIREVQVAEVPLPFVSLLVSPAFREIGEGPWRDDWNSV